MTYRNYFFWLWSLILWTVTEILVFFSIPNCVGTQLSIEYNLRCYLVSFACRIDLNYYPSISIFRSRDMYESKWHCYNQNFRAFLMPYNKGNGATLTKYCCYPRKKNNGNKY